ncbi:MAG: hypothetical protein L6R36_004868 [Xanthoria steineri]|nr:MAG: hypothetical protein L6R36_004868 [Xanthoria steineri]
MGCAESAGNDRRQQEWVNAVASRQHTQRAKDGDAAWSILPPLGGDSTEYILTDGEALLPLTCFEGKGLYEGSGQAQCHHHHHHLPQRSVSACNTPSGMNPLQRELDGGTVHQGDAWTCSKLGEHVPSQPRNSTDGVAAQVYDPVEVLPMGI